MQILSFFVFVHFFVVFCFYLLLGGISESRHQWIWNQHKILRVFDTHIDIFQEKIFLGHNSTFCNLKMRMRKKLYIFKHFAKSKKLFFSKYLSFSVWFPINFKHWSPLLWVLFYPSWFLEFWNNLWGLGTVYEWGCHTGPQGFIGWWNRFQINAWAHWKF